jgi:hypothetical protein
MTYYNIQAPFGLLFFYNTKEEIDTLVEALKSSNDAILKLKL